MIRKLLRNGYRAREIAVICRDAEKYSNELAYAFRKYEIPFLMMKGRVSVLSPLLLLCVSF